MMVMFQNVSQADFQCTLCLLLVLQGHAWVAPPNLFLRLTRKCLKPAARVVVVPFLLCFYPVLKTPNFVLLMNFVR